MKYPQIGFTSLRSRLLNHFSRFVTIKDLEEESERRIRETDELPKHLSQATAVSCLNLGENHTLVTVLERILLPG